MYRHQNLKTKAREDEALRNRINMIRAVHSFYNDELDLELEPLLAMGKKRLIDDSDLLSYIGNQGTNYMTKKNFQSLDYPKGTPKQPSQNSSNKGLIHTIDKRYASVPRNHGHMLLNEYIDHNQDPAQYSSRKPKHYNPKNEIMQEFVNETKKISKFRQSNPHHYNQDLTTWETADFSPPKQSITKSPSPPLRERKFEYQEQQKQEKGEFNYYKDRLSQIYKSKPKPSKSDFYEKGFVYQLNNTYDVENQRDSHSQIPRSPKQHLPQKVVSLSETPYQSLGTNAIRRKLRYLPEPKKGSDYGKPLYGSGGGGDDERFKNSKAIEPLYRESNQEMRDKEGFKRRKVNQNYHVLFNSLSQDPEFQKVEDPRQYLYYDRKDKHEGVDGRYQRLKTPDPFDVLKKKHPFLGCFKEQQAPMMPYTQIQQDSNAYSNLSRENIRRKYQSNDPSPRTSSEGIGGMTKPQIKRLIFNKLVGSSVNYKN